MSLFLDLHQYGRISEAQSDAASAKQKADRFEHRLSEIERRADRLALAAQALWEILRERLELNDEIVFAKMLEIDMRDGVADGKIRPRIMNCTSCGRPINSAKPKCIYCGITNESEHIVQ
jgi:hypothetical protein